MQQQLSLGMNLCLVGRIESGGYIPAGIKIKGVYLVNVGVSGGED